jgi:hypothetical protein
MRAALVVPYGLTLVMKEAVALSKLPRSMRTAWRVTLNWLLQEKQHMTQTVGRRLGSHFGLGIAVRGKLRE